jgi:predicted rRNA methylase YqxC with S4 and FtsJ domains
VIRNPEVHSRALLEFFDRIQPWQIQGLMESPLLGGSGNREFLVHLLKEPGWKMEQYSRKVRELTE